MGFADAPDYVAALRSFVAAYDGPRARAVRHAPALFEFYARLFADDAVGRDARVLVNAVLAYFVVPEDLLPEAELGPWALMDDVYIASHVFRILRRELPDEVIARAWNAEGDLDEVMDFVHGEARTELGKRTREVLRLAGIG